MISIATNDTYESLVCQDFVIVDFYSTTCVPCKMLSRILEDLTLDYPFLNIVKVNTSDYPRLGIENSIDAVPTMFFMKDGKKLETVVGLLDEDEIIDRITSYYYG